MKKTIARALTATMLFEKPMLSYNELQVVLTEVANVVNDCAVRARRLTKEDLVPLTVNQLLLCHHSTQGVTFNSSGELCGTSGLIEHHWQVLEAWWKMWQEQSLSYLLLFYSKKDVKH